MAQLDPARAFSKKQLKRIIRPISKMLRLRCVSGLIQLSDSYDKLLQMNRIDETQEAIARIRMAIDQHDQQCGDGDLDSTPKCSRVTSASWRFGAAGRIINSNTFGPLKSAGGTVQNFDLMLRDFIAEHFPDDRVSYEQRIQVGGIDFRL
jgi:hypothetical protein